MKLCWGKDAMFFGHNKVVAKGPNCPTDKGKLGISGHPRPNNNMPTPCPYILMQWTEQAGALTLILWAI